MKILHHPDKAEIELSSVLYALSDPVRLHVVAEIRKTGERQCSTIETNVAKSTLSHHARTLREAGVVRTRVQGTQRFMALRLDELEERFPGVVSAILDAYDQRLGN